jgi:enoyl-CoA hydratase/carnithine racemase
MEMSEISFTVEDRVGVLTLNRPERKNAFTFAMIETWAQILRDVHSDSTLRAIVLTGAGGAFCSGVDLDDFSRLGLNPLDRKRQLTDQVHQVALAMERLDKPVIAAVDGVAVGAGLDMALMCDMRVVGRSARLSEGYVRVGLVPGDGGCFYLPRLVGVGKALELLLTGDVVDGDEAVRIGMANQVVDDGLALDGAMTLARRISLLPPVAVAMIKRATYQSLRCDLQTSLDLISSHFGVITATEDSQEALRAFREHRQGAFIGR